MRPPCLEKGKTCFQSEVRWIISRGMAKGRRLLYARELRCLTQLFSLPTMVHFDKERTDLGMSRKQFECQVRRAFESYKQMFHREDVRTITIRGKSRSLGLFSQKNFMITRYVRESAHTLSALTCHMEWTELWFTEVFWKIVETLDQLITYETDTKVEHATVPRG